jgi:hypothetical protein
MSNDDTTIDDNNGNVDYSNNIILPYNYCYWLCNRKAELKVYTDFGNILYLCKRCYEIYDPFHRLKTEEMSSSR